MPLKISDALCASTMPEKTMCIPKVENNAIGKMTLVDLLMHGCYKLSIIKNEVSTKRSKAKCNKTRYTSSGLNRD